MGSQDLNLSRYLNIPIRVLEQDPLTLHLPTSNMRATQTRKVMPAPISPGSTSSVSAVGEPGQSDNVDYWNKP